MHMSVHMHGAEVCALACEGQDKLNCPPPCTMHLAFLKWSLELAKQVKLSGPVNPKASSACLHVLSSRDNMHMPTSLLILCRFYRLNSGHWTCKASAFPIELSPQKLII